jgi:antiviral helicase SLH1
VEVSIAEANALSITINLKRLNQIVEREARIYAPKFPKPQSESWFVIVADLTRDEITAVKRVGWTSGNRKLEAGSKPTAKTTIKLPPGEAGQARKFDVLVVSDAYPGLEYRVEGVDIPAPPSVDDAVLSKKATTSGSN